MLKNCIENFKLPGNKQNKFNLPNLSSLCLIDLQSLLRTIDFPLITDLNAFGDS